MEKSCKKCYWGDVKESCKTCKKCEEYSGFLTYCTKCDKEVSEFEYEGDFYCAECIMKELGIEKREVISRNYYVDGEFVGTQHDYSDAEVIKHTNKNAKEI